MKYTIYKTDDGQRYLSMHGKAVPIDTIPPQYDPEPPRRVRFGFIHGPVTSSRGRQLCYTVRYSDA